MVGILNNQIATADKELRDLKSLRTGYQRAIEFLEQETKEPISPPVVAEQ